MTTIERATGHQAGQAWATRPAGWPAQVSWFVISVTAAVLLLGVVAYGAAPLLGYNIKVVGGGSMEPDVPRGSLTISRLADSEDLRIGDIINFRYPQANASLTHRIIAIREVEGQRMFTTKGDANLTPDPLEVELGAGANRVERVVLHAGFLVAFARGTSGLLLTVAAPVLALLAMYLWEPRNNGSKEAKPAQG